MTSMRTAAVAVFTAGLALFGIAVFNSVRPSEPAAPAGPVSAVVAQAKDPIEAAQERLRRNPDDAATWAALGSAYVEKARASADPTYYDRAKGALERSFELQPQGNGRAMIGMGALANARHDFAAAKDWGLRAQAVLPDTAEVFGVLADALTQLGDADGATAAVQRMLDLRPSVSSFTRASYDLELHGRIEEARQAMERALDNASAPDSIAFCRYYLGELAFNSGDFDRAREEYRIALAAAPDGVAARQGLAKVEWARGDLAAALNAYRDVVARQPLPQYLREYAELLIAAGRPADAAAQYAVLDQQQRLAPDDLIGSLVAADRGDAATALRLAQAEWDRRQHVQVADALAWALHLSGRDAEALPLADRALALGTVDASFTYHRGMILRSLGRTAEAEQALIAALRINPRFSPVHAALASSALTQSRGTR